MVVADQRLQFGTLGVLPGRLVGEQSIHRDLLELAFRVLVEAADPDVADTLTCKVPSLGNMSGRSLLPLAGFVSKFRIRPYSDAAGADHVRQGGVNLGAVFRPPGQAAFVRALGKATPVSSVRPVIVSRVR